MMNKEILLNEVPPHAGPMKMTIAASSFRQKIRIVEKILK
jgi:hypothetical protein